MTPFYDAKQMAVLASNVTKVMPGHLGRRADEWRHARHPAVERGEHTCEKGRDFAMCVTGIATPIMVAPEPNIVVRIDCTIWRSR